MRYLNSAQVIKKYRDIVECMERLIDKDSTSFGIGILTRSIVRMTFRESLA